MITDPRVFEDEHLPSELIHREPEIEELTRAFAPATSGGPATDVMISGPSCVEKTALARFALEQLRDVAPIASTLIRCLGITDENLLRRALKDIDAPEFAANATVPELRDRLFDDVHEPYIVVLYEAADVAAMNAVE